MCAGVAGQRGRSVLVLEQARQPAEKIRISGGGRCNFTNLHTSPANFLSDNPRFCHSALSGYTQRDFIALVEQLRHRLSREDARAIVLRRLVAADHRHAAGGMPQGPRAIASGRAHLRDLEERRRLCRRRPIRASFAAASLVVATGGPSIPKMGSSGFGYKIAEQFGLEDRAAARGAGAADLRRRVAGAIRGSVRRLGRCRRELRQDTFRRGAAVHPSRAERSGDPADIVLLARGPGHRHRHGAGDRCAGRAEAIAPRSSAAGNGDRAGRVSCRSGWRATIADATGGPGAASPISPTSLLAKVAAAVKQWRVRPNGTEGYRTAEVTLGGVDTSELSSKTFEAQVRARALFHRRSRRRHRPPRRLQFSMGVVVGIRRRPAPLGVFRDPFDLPMPAVGCPATRVCRRMRHPDATIRRPADCHGRHPVWLPQC